MTLLNNFYNNLSATVEENKLQVDISINPGHEIFQGHFPGQPVVPGVCMVQIVKEILEQHLNQHLIFNKGYQLKFLQILVPVKDEKVEVSIQWKEVDSEFHTTADFKREGHIIFKLSGNFKPL